ncbi:MAG: metalloregulator ArsR/SmtB family transcription factor [Chloroflexota bacterium]|nr:metalloregulator ArsR/SmtB family transcription factor [Chloroflexota bacterium]MDP9473142.1 metalloregulator ArsR/SmtB family transcription factor [Chloroflexota bacterium]
MARPRKQDQLAALADLSCEEQLVHVDAVRAARATLPAVRALAALGDLFAALGDPTRLRIMAALAERELCVCDLAATVGHSESAVSHHLRLMRSIGLVRARREGRLAYYALDDAHVTALYGQALAHIRHQISEDGS